MENKKEEWRDIVICKNGITYDYTGLYKVSNTGKIYSVKAGRCLSPSPAGQGKYLRVGLWKNGEKISCYVHVLVATMFIENPDNLPQVNHKDENNKNNDADNLEWCTAEYNINYGNHNRRVSQTRIEKGYAKGEKNYFYDKHFYGSSNGNAKKVVCLNTGQVFDTKNDAVRWTGQKIDSGVSKCCHKKQEVAGKHPVTGEPLKWMFYDEYLKLKEEDDSKNE